MNKIGNVLYIADSSNKVMKFDLSNVFNNSGSLTSTDILTVSSTVLYI